MHLMKALNEKHTYLVYSFIKSSYYAFEFNPFLDLKLHGMEAIMIIKLMRTETIHIKGHTHKISHTQTVTKCFFQDSLQKI